jgi:hypothetical protein
MVASCYSEGSDKNQPSEEEAKDVFEHLEDPNPENWPYSTFDLTRLLKKWNKKISVDLAAHVPPKMACFIGTFWKVFGADEGYKHDTFKLLNRLIFDIWLKPMLPIINVNAGYIYQLTKQDQ